MNLHRPAAGAITVALAGVALMGCSAHASFHIGGGISQSKLKSGVKRVASELGLKAASVTCPSDVKEKQGTISFCSVKDASGGATRFKVTQTNGSGHVLITPATVIAPLVESRVEQALAAKQVKNVTVVCPSGEPIATGTMFLCTATQMGSKSLHVQITITGNDGTSFHYKLVD